MVRAFGGSLAMLAILFVCLAQADDQKQTANKNKDRHHAKISKVDPQTGTVTVKMKDRDGKETEKTFKLAADAVYLDSTGKVAAVDIFRSGDEVLILEAEGKVKELKKNDRANRTDTDKKNK